MQIHILLLYALLILNTTLRFFTNELGVLPRLFNIADVFLVVLLVLVALLRRDDESTEFLRFKPILRNILLFNVVLVVGALLNLDAVYFRASLSEVVMWNEPILLFLAVMSLPLKGRAIVRFIRILYVLIVVEFVIGILQIPIYVKTGETEAIIGTFRGNAEQYAGFMIMGMFFLMGKIVTQPSRKFRYGAMVLGIMMLTLLIDNKASWAAIGVSTLYLVVKLGSLQSKMFHRFIAVALFAVFLFLGFSVVTRNSMTLYKFEKIGEAWREGEIRNLGKIKSYFDVVELYKERPVSIAVGAGPATFYSRSSRQFYFKYWQSSYMYSNPWDLSETANYRQSNSMGGLMQAVAREPYYGRFSKNQKIYSIGSATVDEPFSSFVALLGETGLLGFGLYLWIYWVVFSALGALLLKYRQDQMILPLLAATLGFMTYLLLNATYQTWLETGRMTTILWAMVAVCFKVDEQMRRHDALEGDVA